MVPVTSLTKYANSTLSLFARLATINANVTQKQPPLADILKENDEGEYQDHEKGGVFLKYVRFGAVRLMVSTTGYKFVRLSDFPVRAIEPTRTSVKAQRISSHAKKMASLIVSSAPRGKEEQPRSGNVEYLFIKVRCEKGCFSEVHDEKPVASIECTAPGSMKFGCLIPNSLQGV